MPRDKKHYFTELAENITIANCKGRIIFLSKRIAQISGGIDVAKSLGDKDLKAAYEILYDCMNTVLDKLIDFESTHDCLVEGDDGYEAL